LWFIDDRTRYIDVVMLKKRSDVLVAFKNYVAKVEREHERKIKRLRSDMMYRRNSTSSLKIKASRGSSL